jgi:hypothetical protein
MDGRWTRVPDGIEPLIGYRAWRYWIEPDHVHLCPLAWVPDAPIPAGANRSPADDVALAWDGASSHWVTASCRTRGGDPWHFAPVEDCSCGFYAFKELASLVDNGWLGVVLGRVELSGKLIEHDWGFRAERARIAELIPLRGTERSVMLLANRLGVPIAPSVDPPIPEELARRYAPPAQETGSTSASALRGRVADLLRIAAICALVAPLWGGAHAGSVNVSLTPSLVLLALSQICRPDPHRR